MRQFVRSGLVASLFGLLASVTDAQGQGPGTAQPKGSPPAKSAAPGKAAAAAPAKGAMPAPPPRPAILDQVFATVNGEAITRADLIQYLNTFGLPPGEVSDQDKYKIGIEGIANFKLANQFLAKQNVPVAEKDIDAEYNTLAEALKKDGQDINVALASSGLTVAAIRDEMKKKFRWRNYLDSVATDPVLKKYVDDHKDVFSMTQVKASHIVLRVDPDASAEEKAKVRAQLAAIKAEIDGNKISFADAANKYSVDDANKVSPSGGDLGYFTRRGQLEERFAAAAFALKKGSVSDPVETPFGYHLIQVTDRKEGKPIDFEQNKLQIKAEYGADLQERIVADMRKSAKIDIKPMPADLFPKAPVPTQGPAGSPPPGKAAAPKAAAPAPKQP